MPVYLDTRGKSVLSVAICDRCRIKFPYDELMPDPNFPGMRVCHYDLDQFDPWRLPAIKTENIALRFPRPDTDIAIGPVGGQELQTEGGPDGIGDSIFIDENPPGSTTAGEPGDISI
jgi:hypothetical protein